MKNSNTWDSSKNMIRQEEKSMTPEQAIEYLQLEELCNKIDRPCHLYCGTCPYNVKHTDFIRAYHMAIEALEREAENGKTENTTTV